MPHLDLVPDGAHLFLDSTILHYALVDFAPATEACLRLLRRANAGEVVVSTSVPALNDAVHKVLCSEAVSRLNRPRAGLVRWLKEHPDQMRRLSAGDDVLRLCDEVGVRLLGQDAATLRLAQRVIADVGLLAGDALIVATMRAHQVEDIATNDDDFDRLSALRAWKPR
jgi:predicted nucleic acid-binding protein